MGSQNIDYSILYSYYNCLSLHCQLPTAQELPLPIHLPSNENILDNEIKENTRPDKITSVLNQFIVLHSFSVFFNKPVSDICAVFHKISFLG